MFAETAEIIVAFFETEPPPPVTEMTPQTETAELVVSMVEMWLKAFGEIINLLFIHPEQYRGGVIWRAVETVYTALMPGAIALLTVFFVSGLMKTLANITEIKRAEVAVKAFVRFILSYLLVTQGLELLSRMITIGLSFLGTLLFNTLYTPGHGSFIVVAGDEAIIEPEFMRMLNDVRFTEAVGTWALALIGCIATIAMSVMLLLTVYGRFFKIYVMTAIAPIPLSAVAGEPTQGIAITYLKAFAGVVVEGLLIFLACYVFTLYIRGADGGIFHTLLNTGNRNSSIWHILAYIADFLFSLMVLLGTVKISTSMVKELTSL